MGGLARQQGLWSPGPGRWIYAAYRRIADALGPRTVRIAGGPLAGKTLGARWSLRRSPYAGGDYEPAVADALDALARSGSVAFDVGAHFGYFTLLLARRAAHVYAFEPAPANFRALRRTLADNHIDNASAYPLAVAASDGDDVLAITAASSMCRLHGNTRAIPRAGEGVVQRARVETVRLDSFVQHARVPRVDLVKLDVEGHELHALLGMQGVVRRWQPALVIEVHRELAGGEDPRHVLHLLDRWGYVCRDLDVGGRPITSLAHTWSEHHILAERGA
ncbi:MAG: FkbM family methyltransferase [Anaerolineae bacterium]|nr:FkbM family methyltransferase [Anaerolineae bacterium]